MQMDGRIRKALETTGPGLVTLTGMLAADLADGSVLVQAKPGSTRHAVLMGALANSVAAEPALRILVVAPGDRDVAVLRGACDSIVGPIGIAISTIGRENLDAESGIYIGSMEAVASQAASGALDARSFGLIALSDLDAMADAASVVMLRRALGAAHSGRRLVAFSAEPGPSHRAMVRDLAGSAKELSLEIDGERLKSTPSNTWMVSAADKLRLFSGLTGGPKNTPAAVFCNTRDTAEMVARQLKAEGISVEYILGNLPRKRAVFESVVAGRFDVLVLTDEGANGLPGAWAHVLFNWDIPLEGEPYLARLAHLDTSFDRAHVHNFACDRYSVGLQNIEKALGFRLSAVTADDTVMAQKKADPRPDVPDRRNDSVKNQRGSPDTRDRGGQYDGRNVRSIQADIAAITGGFSLNDPKKAAAAQEPSRKKRGRKTGEARRQAPVPTKAGATGTQKPARNAPGPARQKKKGGSARPASGTHPRSGGGPRLADPYSVSMEERLRLYRERYGNDAPHDSEKKMNSPVSQPGTAKPAAKSEAPSTASAPKGIFGAIKGMFTGKTDQD